MRNIIVTGGSRGLGLGIARKLSDAGYSIIAIARHESEQLVAAAREADGKAGSLHFREFDLADLSGIPGLIKAIRKDFGTIYGLVNNVAVGTSGVLATMRDTEIENIVRLNTISPLIMTKYAIRAMMLDHGGRIVNISSIVSFTGFSGLAVYAATKASLVGFTRSLAREVGPLGITVNAVAPGFIDTNMTENFTGPQRQQVLRRSPLRRLAEIEDVANAVEFLLDDKACNITGTTLTVDAGSTA
jgi:3-oxoacyl-[acyl-carrier protein] reductase